MRSSTIISIISVSLSLSLPAVVALPHPAARLDSWAVDRRQVGGSGLGSSGSSLEQVSQGSASGDPSADAASKAPTTAASPSSDPTSAVHKSQSQSPTITRSAQPSHTASKSSSSDESSASDALSSTDESVSASASSTTSAQAQSTQISTAGTLHPGSNIPEACAQSCANAYWRIDNCLEDSDSCTDLCGYVTYTDSLTCLNCLVGYSSPGVNATSAQGLLDNIEDMCMREGLRIESTGRVTAQPTAR